MKKKLVCIALALMLLMITVPSIADSLSRGTAPYNESSIVGTFTAGTVTKSSDEIWGGTWDSNTSLTFSAGSSYVYQLTRAYDTNGNLVSNAAYVYSGQTGYLSLTSTASSSNSLTFKVTNPHSINSSVTLKTKGSCVANSYYPSK